MLRRVSHAYLMRVFINQLNVIRIKSKNQFINNYYMKKSRRIPKELFVKITKKLHLNRMAVQLLRPLKHKCSSMSVDEAKAILVKKSPKPEGTALRSIQVNEKSDYKYDLQIIVPAYNVEKYIIQCIESLRMQTDKYKWQAIIINDGSTDTTGKLIDRYKKDRRLQIIHQNNKGFSGARNTGIRLLDARYVMFLDSDDFLESGAIEALMTEADRYNADIVEGNFNYYKRGKKKRGSFHRTGVVKRPVDDLKGFPWGKIIRSSFFDRYQFPEGFWFEDTIMSFLIYPQGTSVRTIEASVYNYRVNDQGITNTIFGKAKCIDTVWILDEIVSSGELMRYDRSVFRDLVLKHIMLSCNRCQGLDRKVRESVFICLRKIYLDDFYFDDISSVTDIEIYSALINNDFGEYELISRFQ